MKKKQAAALVTAAVMALSLTACGGSGGADVYKRQSWICVTVSAFMSWRRLTWNATRWLTPKT